MLSKITSYLLLGNQYCGIEHTLINGKETIIATILKKTKDKLKIDSVFESDSIENISKLIPKNTPAFLVVNNTNVLTKKTENGRERTIEIVHQAFPNIDANDFMYEILIQNESHFVSICRKSYLEKLIESYKNEKISIINLALGNLIIASITDFINVKSVTSTNAEINLTNNEIRQIEPLQTIISSHYNINGLEVNNKSLLSSSAVIASILENNKNITNFETEKHHLKTVYSRSVFFRKFLFFGLIFLLSTLSVNFLIFNYYFNKLNTLEQSVQANQSVISQINELNEQVLKSQNIVEDLIYNSNSKSSYFINEIIKELPISIQLNELIYQPLLKTIKKEETITVEGATIRVSGESIDSETFSDWIVGLEKKIWINKIEVTDYADISPTKANFKFKIILNHDK